MFIKIKLEPQNSKALPPLKNISYFSIDDDATILVLKMRIEEYVDVPAERQEVRTLMKTFNNNLKVKDVCEVNGTAIMVYAYDEYYKCQEPQFVCFLQVYTDEMAAQQQEMEHRSKLQSRSKESTPNSSSSSATLVAILDTDESDETDSETASNKSSESDSEASASSSDNSDSKGGKKRTKHGKQSTQQKKLRVTASSGGQYSPNLCQYVDEFPTCSKQTNSENKTVNKTQQSTNRKPTEIKPNANGNSSSNKNSIEIFEDTNKTLPVNIKSGLCQNTPNTHPEQKFIEDNNSTSLNNIQSNIISTTNNNNIHPCYAINPEIREYVVIISKNDKNDNINNNECEELLVWFFNRFRTCDTLSKLQFYYQTSVSLFEGKLWIACMDKNTFEWISASISEYHLKSYKILSLKETPHFCEVVVPIVSNSKNILDIFDLLEKQNQNLSTLKWSIKIRKILLPEDKSFIERAISIFCTNEILHINMDKESKDYIEKFNFKLKYCFWQIVFKFV